MNFNKHSNLEGAHAFLGCSQHYWLNYSEDKLVDVYIRNMAKLKGTMYHDLAAKCIKLRQRLPKSQKTLCMYVNDAIGYRMIPEQPLYYSRNCFGTADAIAYDEKKKFLRIHDLKTGTTRASMDQLRIYDALFCLEYNFRPGDITIENRIYQSDEIVVDEPQADDIAPIMDKIIKFDKIIERLREEEAWIDDSQTNKYGNK